jgi:hypothetical protein
MTKNEADTAVHPPSNALFDELDTFEEIWEKDPIEGGEMSDIFPGIPPESVTVPTRPTSSGDFFIA